MNIDKIILVLGVVGIAAYALYQGQTEIAATCVGVIGGVLVPKGDKPAAAPTAPTQ